MAEQKTTRDMTTRASTARPTKWEPPTLLPEPDKEPGYEYRWIRTSLLNEADPRNISSRFREGWEPVSINEQPKFKFMTDADSKFKDNIEIGGLLLCKIPAEFIDQRNDYYQGISESQMTAVDNNFMKENDPRMPLFKERKSQVRFGNG